ncbi:two-component regulator propeller domain-containing protein [Flavobacterium sp. 1355]|uniref:hybrid sensor histidine kinase/response regulator transcription factor n=1 Tax=Flavobacterium sp. 1355 TaxID=2806571 RepID=UPI001AE89328|nr:two-component regulator propeller domain-containing protein [Flavobacterium sp. 1355]MBP1225458.1 signal transduction histidine kinase/ligand-binding sensor domain-containing protein/DNA-binding response OmpR family regulator [Flavobacterium sp. 1355]
MKNIKFILLCFFSLSNCLFSQGKFDSYQFRTIQETTTKRAISSIIQDNNGFIWIGTNGAGLYRYDGVNYFGYKYDKKPGSLNSNFIYTTFIDSANNLWIGTDEGLCLYNRDLDNFTKINIEDVIRKGYNEPITIKTIIQDNNGNLFLGAYGFGLFKLNIKTLKASLVQSKVLDKPNFLIKSSVKNKQGTIYLGTSYGLLEIDLNGKVKQVYKDKFKREPLLDDIESLVIDKFGYLWLGTTENGLIKIKPETDNYQFENFFITKNKILSIVQSSQDYIVCGTENDGLLVVNYKGQVLQKYLHSKYNSFSLKSNSVWSLYEDKEKRLWLGYFNKGLGVFDKPNNKFNSLESLANNDNSLQTSYVTSVIKDKKGNLLISNEGGGLDIYNLSNKSYIHVNKNNQNYYSGLDAVDIQTIFIDSKQNIWIGSWDRGIYFLKNGTTRFINYNTANSTGLKSNRVFSFSEDSKGRIWIGTFIKGLHYFDNKTSTIIHCDSKPFSENALDNAFIRKVFVDSDNILWVGTILGLYQVNIKDESSFKVTKMRDAMFSGINRHNRIQTILSIYESNDKTIWIGTDGQGLFSYNKKNKVFSNYDDFPGFTEKSVRAIISDNNGSLWISGGSGLTKLDFKNKKSTNFNKDDGLIDNDFNNNAVFKDGNGELYFGGYEGVNYFNPSEIKKTEKAPRLYFSDFKLFNRSVKPNEEGSPLTKVISQTKEITLNYTQSVFTIEYVGINYNYSKKNQYAYYLEGFEKDWNYAGNNRTATYTNLAPGNYVFKVKSANADGSWSNDQLELKIKILPPWWKTFWAYLIYATILIFLIRYLNKIYQNRFKAKQAIILEKEKSIQLEKLNNKKLQFFTNISHEFRTPLTLIINPLEDILRSKKLSPEIHNKLKIVHKSSDRLSRLINELMDFNKLEFNKISLQAKKIEVIAFTEGIIGYFDEEAAARNISVNFESSLDELEDWLDPKMLEKILFNIISNAFKFTPDNGSITISIATTDPNNALIIYGEKVPSFSITITDTGSGIRKKDLNRIFDRFYQVNNVNKDYYGSTGIGLEVVKEFVELHKGKIEVESQLGEGTKFKVIFPLGNSLYKKSEIIDEVFKIEKNKNQFVFEAVNNQTDEDDFTDETIDKSAEESAKSYTVLIVEDNPELRHYLKQELSKSYKVITAENGKKGYELAVQKLPDLIITDVIMPVMDGLQLCKNIKGDLKTSHIPLLMLSAKAMVKDRLEGIDSGADMYLSKPFELDILKSSLAQLITSRQIMFKKFYSGITKQGKEKTTSLDNDFIQKILHFINENISEPELTVELLSSKIFLSRSQLYRKIKTLTGVSVNEFIRNVRLEKAKQLIEKGNNNINEISYKVGFTSPSYFAKCYKVKYGYLPTQENRTKE